MEWPITMVSSGLPALSMSEQECEAYANSIGLAFTAHDDTAITGFTRYSGGGCYCSSHYGGVDPSAGAARYTRGWATANGVASTEACRDLCYNNLQEAKAVQGCSRLPVSTVRSDTSMNDVIVYIRNSYYDPPIQCNANNFAGVCIEKEQIMTGTLTECEDACANDPTCRIVSYDYDTRFCRYGVGNKVEGTSMVCSYDRDKDSFLGFVPEQACDAEFTPHSDPSLDQFQSYMLGNVEYNVGGVSCSDCPQGQYPITTYGYTCETGIQRNMYCADGLEGNCLFGFVGTSKLFDCKAQCNLIENCQVLNFLTDTDFETGSCYLFSAAQKELPVNNPMSITCERVQTSSECSPCAAGKFKKSRQQTVCSPCILGTYQDETGQAACKACDVETYQDTYGQTSCKGIDQFYIVHEETNRDINYAQMTHVLINTFEDIQTKEECVKEVGLAGFKIMVFEENGDDDNCLGFYSIETVSNLQANQIVRREAGFLSGSLRELTTGSFIAASINYDKKVCIGSTLVGVASGPLQDNSVTDTPTYNQGGTLLCSGCANFTIQVPGTDRCESCTPGFYYTEVPSVRCEACAPGFSRETEITLGPLDSYTGPPYTGSIYSDVFPQPLNCVESSASCNRDAWPVVNSESFRCTPCLPGKYQPSEQQTSCTECEIGRYTDSFFSETCIDCPIGQFINTVGHFKSKSDTATCTLCSLGQYQGEEGKSFCLDCEYGEYSDQQGSSACKLCSAGRYRARVGGLKAECNRNSDPPESYVTGKCCQLCVPGKFSNAGATICTNCPTGKVQDQFGAFACNDCDPGRYMGSEGQFQNSNLELNTCNICPVGKYSGRGATACTNCNSGEFQNEEGQTGCKTCDIGKFSGISGWETACTVCNPGRYADVEGLSACKYCPDGEITNDWHGYVQCRKCVEGRFERSSPTNQFNRYCYLCDFGHYQDEKGKTSCKACPPAKHLNVHGATSSSACQDCPPEYISLLYDSTYAQSTREETSLSIDTHHNHGDPATVWTFKIKDANDNGAYGAFSSGSDFYNDVGGYRGCPSYSTGAGGLSDWDLDLGRCCWNYKMYKNSAGTIFLNRACSTAISGWALGDPDYHCVHKWYGGPHDCGCNGNDCDEFASNHRYWACVPASWPFTTYDWPDGYVQYYKNYYYGYVHNLYWGGAPFTTRNQIWKGSPTGDGVVGTTWSCTSMYNRLNANGVRACADHPRVFSCTPNEWCDYAGQICEIVDSYQTHHSTYYVCKSGTWQFEYDTFL